MALCRLIGLQRATSPAQQHIAAMALHPNHSILLGHSLGSIAVIVYHMSLGSACALNVGEWVVLACMHAQSAGLELGVHGIGHVSLRMVCQVELPCALC